MVDAEGKRTLGAIFALGLNGRLVRYGRLAETLGLRVEELESRLESLGREGLVARESGAVSLTDEGRRGIRVVFIGGGFEVVHIGHVYTISRAKRLGDVLVAVVARDSTIRKRKGREPITKERQRVALLSSLRQVDAAILGGKGNIYDMLEKVRPDIVALGYDQHHREEEISKEAARRGLRVSVVRLGTPDPSVKTTRLLREI